MDKDCMFVFEVPWFMTLLSSENIRQDRRSFRPDPGQVRGQGLPGWSGQGSEKCWARFKTLPKSSAWCDRDYGGGGVEGEGLCVSLGERNRCGTLDGGTARVGPAWPTGGCWMEEEIHREIITRYHRLGRQSGAKQRHTQTPKISVTVTGSFPNQRVREFVCVIHADGWIDMCTHSYMEYNRIHLLSSQSGKKTR